MSSNPNIIFQKDKFDGFSTGKWSGKLPQGIFEDVFSQLPGKYTKDELIIKTKSVAEQQARLHF